MHDVENKPPMVPLQKININQVKWNPDFINKIHQ